jgi:hypothetical protein
MRDSITSRPLYLQWNTTKDEHEKIDAIYSYLSVTNHPDVVENSEEV